jgi:hypothetical protein
MSRRCKPGQRARIIGGGWNRGKVVLVVRHYFGEQISGGTWPEAIFPWVVSSLSVPLRSQFLDTGIEATPSMTIVMDDRDLQPLDDDDDGLKESTDIERPNTTIRSVDAKEPCHE